MYFKLKIVFAILLIISTPFNLYAKGSYQKNKVMSESDFKHLSKILWNASFDIKALKENKLLNFFDNYHLYVDKNAKFRFNNIPSKINRIYMYGNTVINQGSINMNLFGDFKEVSVENLVFNQLLNNKKSVQLKKLKTYGNNENTVYVYKVLDKESKKKIYATKVDDDFIIVSNRKITDKFKVRNPFDFFSKVKNNREVKNNDVLVSLEMNLEAMRKKLQENSYILQSKVFNNTNTLVFKAVKDHSNILLGSSLNTTNNDTAIQIKKVIVGIVTNIIQKDQNLNEIKTIFFKNLQTTIEDNRVILNTNIPLTHKK